MLLMDIDCRICGETKSEMISFSEVDRDICRDCIEAEKRDAEAVHMMSLQFLGLERRVERIERLLYQLAVNNQLNWQMKERVLKVGGDA